MLKFILFADDTNICYSGNDLDVMCKLSNDELEKLHVWFCVNKLSLKLNKTEYMIFSNVRRNQNSELRILLFNDMNMLLRQKIVKKNSLE